MNYFSLKFYRFSLIRFSINSGNELSSSGMLLSLLSLCLATLMALFRDDNFSMVVSATELALLIRDTGAALLDDRLTSSDELSEDDRSQVIRAINKVSCTFLVVLPWILLCAHFFIQRQL